MKLKFSKNSCSERPIFVGKTYYILRTVLPLSVLYFALFFGSGHILLAHHNTSSIGQIKARTITGKVTDEKGEGLPGVSVIIKGATSGTITTATGEYTIAVENDANILIFSYLG